MNVTFSVLKPDQLRVYVGRKMCDRAKWEPSFK